MAMSSARVPASFTILLGDDMYLFEREEYDPEQGTWRKLAPGDPGELTADLSVNNPYGEQPPQATLLAQ